MMGDYYWEARRQMNDPLLSVVRRQRDVAEDALEEAKTRIAILEGERNYWSVHNNEAAGRIAQLESALRTIAADHWNIAGCGTMWWL